MNLKKVIIEEIQKFSMDLPIMGIAQEGVADKAAERMFNIPDPNVEMNDKALKGLQDPSMGEHVATFYNLKNRGCKIYKNPKSLKNFAADVRAVGTRQGDVYVFQTDIGAYHSKITMALQEAGIDIGTAYDQMHNVTLHRLNEREAFAYSVSYQDFALELVNQDIVKETFDNLNHKNPTLEFINEYWLELVNSNIDD